MSTDDPLETLALAVGYPFASPALLEQAVTHSSYSHENRVGDYERLEFLGDAVLQLCTTVLLYERFSEAHEGQLSRSRARLVSTTALATLGARLGIGPALRLGVGEEATGGRDRPRVVAGAVEAVLGAVFQDGGFEAAAALVRRWMAEPLEELAREETQGWKDPRSLLQERTQSVLGETPVYDVTVQDGPPHRPRFGVAVRVGNRVLATGEGPSKREASRQAAALALQVLEKAG